MLGLEVQFRGDKVNAGIVGEGRVNVYIVAVTFINKDVRLGARRLVTNNGYLATRNGHITQFLSFRIDLVVIS